MQPFISAGTLEAISHAVLIGMLAFSVASIARLDRVGIRQWWWIRNPSLLDKSRLLVPAIGCIVLWCLGTVLHSLIILLGAIALGALKAYAIGTGTAAWIARDEHRRKIEMRHWEMRKPSEYRLAHQAQLQKRQLDRVQDEALRRLMDPHFLFNALNGIVHDLMQEKPSRAMRHLKAFNRLAERQIQSGQEGWISLVDQWESLAHYLALEVRRLDRPIASELVPLKSELRHTLIPSLMLQPLAENALWHGLGGTSNQSSGNLVIRASPLDGHHVVVEICNSPSAPARSFPDPIRPEMVSPRRRHAMDLIRHRLNLLDRSGRSSLTMNHDQTWTVARVVLPCRLSAVG